MIEFTKVEKEKDRLSNLSNKLHFLDGTDGGTNQPKIYKKRDFKRNPLSHGSGNEKKTFLHIPG